jgi:hypothetical protein
MDRFKHHHSAASGEVAMDREMLETLCQSFASRQSSAFGLPAAADPVSEILRSFRLAEISAAEMESLLGLVTAGDESEGNLPAGLMLAGMDAGLDEPPAMVDDFPDFDLIVARGFDEDDDVAGAPAENSGVEVRLSPLEPGAHVAPFSSREG